MWSNSLDIYKNYKNYGLTSKATIANETATKIEASLISDVNSIKNLESTGASASAKSQAKNDFINKYNIIKQVNVIPTGIDIDKFKITPSMKKNIQTISQNEANQILIWIARSTFLNGIIKTTSFDVAFLFYLYFSINNLYRYSMYSSLKIVGNKISSLNVLYISSNDLWPNFIVSMIFLP